MQQPLLSRHRQREGAEPLAELIGGGAGGRGAGSAGGGHGAARELRRGARLGEAAFGGVVGRGHGGTVVSGTAQRQQQQDRDGGGAAAAVFR